MNEESDMSSYQHPDVNRQKQNYLLQDHNHYNLLSQTHFLQKHKQMYSLYQSYSSIWQEVHNSVNIRTTQITAIFHITIHHHILYDKC